MKNIKGFSRFIYESLGTLPKGLSEGFRPPTPEEIKKFELGKDTEGRNHPTPEKILIADPKENGSNIVVYEPWPQYIRVYYQSSYNSMLVGQPKIEWAVILDKTFKLNQLDEAVKYANTLYTNKLQPEGFHPELDAAIKQESNQTRQYRRR